MNPLIKTVKIVFLDDRIEVISEDAEYDAIRWRENLDGELFSDVGDDDWRPVKRWDEKTEPVIDAPMQLENDIYDAVKIAFKAANEIAKPRQPKFIDELDPAQVVLSIVCPNCGEQQPDLMMNHFQLLAWRNGVHIQEAFPSFTPGQRELMISGTCETCFDKMFGGEDA